MALRFQPYPMPPEEEPRESPAATAAGGLQNTLALFLQFKNQQDALQAQREGKMVDLAKASSEGGDDFWNTYAALRAGKQPGSVGMPMPGAAPMPSPTPPTPGLMTPAPDPYSQYQSVQDPYGPLPGMSTAAAPAAPMSMAPAPSAAPGAPPPGPQGAMDITPDYLAQIRKQKGSRGLKEFTDQQSFLTNQKQADAQMGNIAITNESKMRDDYAKASGNFKVVSEQIQTIQSIANRPPSAAGDLSLIFSYMKLVDPGSTVREGEQASAANAAGVPDRVRALYNRAMTGERLAGAQRADFINTSGDLYQGWLDKQKQTDDAFRGIATRSRVNPENVMLPYGVSNFDRAALAKSPGATAMQGGAATPPAAQPGGGMVKVQRPDGTVGSIPRANLAKAEQRGYKAVQ